MAKLLYVIVLALSPGLGFGQIEPGEYRLCFSMYWKCHFQLQLVLLKDNHYNFIYSDDTRQASSTGTYRLNSDKIILTPASIPDTIKITFNERDITRTIKKRFAEEDSLKIGSRHVISITKDFEPLGNYDVEISSDRKFVTRTDSRGNATFTGPIPDSIKIILQDRVFKFYPKSVDDKKLFQIWIETDHKDVALDWSENGVIRIDDGGMYLNEWNEETQKSDRVYFRKLR